MAQHLVVQGRMVTTVPEVLAAYRPTPARISSEEWDRLRPTVIRAVEKTGFDSIHGAHYALRVVSGFCAWACDEGVALDPEALFSPDRVERFIGTARASATILTRANERSALRRVGRAATTVAPWPPEPQPFQDHVHLKRPYSDEEIDGFWRVSGNQATERRRQVMTTMLVLGLGAGLKPREVLECAAHQVKTHRSTGLTAIFLPDRTVPVRCVYAARLHDLCRVTADGPLIGQWSRERRDPFTGLRRGIEIPSYLPTLVAARLRTTWMAKVLAQDLRISEFMVIAGTASSKSLECIAPFVAGRWADDEYLHKAAGL